MRIVAPFLFVSFPRISVNTMSNDFDVWHVRFWGKH